MYARAHLFVRTGVLLYACKRVRDERMHARCYMRVGLTRQLAAPPALGRSRCWVMSISISINMMMMMIFIIFIIIISMIIILGFW